MPQSHIIFRRSLSIESIEGKGIPSGIAMKKTAKNGERRDAVIEDKKFTPSSKKSAEKRAIKQATKQAH